MLVGTSWRIPRESVEWVGPITVLFDDAPFTDFEVAFLLVGVRPEEADWESPSDLDGSKGILVGPGTGHVPNQDRPSAYRIWVRAENNPETPVLSDVGEVLFT